jgi:hypothetical protein
VRRKDDYGLGNVPVQLVTHPCLGGAFWGFEMPIKAPMGLCIVTVAIVIVLGIRAQNMPRTQNMPRVLYLHNKLH